MLASSFISRDVRVATAGGVDLGTYRVRPPSAREAITLIEVCEGEVSEDAFLAASDVLRTWLPARLWSLLLSRAFTRRAALEVALSLLSVGLPDGNAERETKKRAYRRSWDSVCAEYLHVYPSASLDDPWPLFVERCMRIDEIRAKASLDHFMGAAVASTGKGLDSLQQRAGFEEVYDEEAAMAEQMRNLEAIGAVYHKYVNSPKIGRA